MSDANRWAIEADAIAYAYPDGAAALVDLTLRAAVGEFVAVVGPNGAGKTTLMRLLLGLIKPSRGQIRLGDVDIAQLSPAERYRRVGIVFQNPTDQLFAATVEEDVAFGPRNLGLAESEVATRVDEALAAVDALTLRSRPVHRLSFGEQRRVCLAGVLAMRPEVLVLDEPLAGLDPGAEARMLRLLVDLNRKQGKTIILSTHSVDLLPAAAHRIYVLARGQVCLEGTPAQVFREPAALEQADLRLPLIAQLFYAINGCSAGATEGLPLTVEEGCRRILGQKTNSHQPDEPS